VSPQSLQLLLLVTAGEIMFSLYRLQGYGEKTMRSHRQEFGSNMYAKPANHEVESNFEIYV